MVFVMFVTEVDKKVELTLSLRLEVKVMPMPLLNPTEADLETVPMETRALWLNLIIRMKKTPGKTVSIGERARKENGTSQIIGLRKENLTEKPAILLKEKDMFLDTLIKMKELVLLVKDLKEP